MTSKITKIIPAIIGGGGGGGGVATVTAGTRITNSGTAADPILNHNGHALITDVSSQTWAGSNLVIPITTNDKFVLNAAVNGAIFEVEGVPTAGTRFSFAVNSFGVAPLLRIDQTQGAQNWWTLVNGTLTDTGAANYSLVHSGEYSAFYLNGKWVIAALNSVAAPPPLAGTSLVKVLYFAANPLSGTYYYLEEGEAFWRLSSDGTVTAFGSGTVPQSAGTVGINTSVASIITEYRFWDGLAEVSGFAGWQITSIDVEAQVSFPNWGKTGNYTSGTTAAWAKAAASYSANILTALILRTALNGIYYNNAGVGGSDFGGSGLTFNTTARQFRYRVVIKK